MDQLTDLKNYHSVESNRMEWFYKDCVITITTSKTGELFHFDFGNDFASDGSGLSLAPFVGSVAPINNL